MIAFTVVCIAQCLPMSYVWSFIGGGTGSCIDRTSWVWALSGVEIGWDLIVILLPIPKLLGLNISNQRKIGYVWVRPQRNIDAELYQDLPGVPCWTCRHDLFLRETQVYSWLHQA